MTFGFTSGATATVAQFEAALRTVKYTDTSDNPSGLDRTVVFQANDGGATDNLSNAPTKTIHVIPVNDAPVIDLLSGTVGVQTTAQTAAFDEGTGVAGATPVTLLPQVIGLLVGHLVLRMNPILLLGALAGSQTVTAAMAAIQERSGSPVAVLGYTPSYPVSNILLTIWGGVMVLVFAG